MSVTGDIFDPNPDNNTAEQQTTVGGADLEVSKADSPDPVLVGETLIYTVVVTNHGPSTTTAELIDTLPESVDFESATSTAGSCSKTGDFTVTCSLGILGSGESATSTIEVTPRAAGIITNSVSVTGDIFDPNPDNNTATQETTVAALTDCDCTEGLGFWKKQFKGKGKQHIDDDTLESFLRIIRLESGIFDEAFALGGIADANRIFNNKGGNKDKDKGNRGRGHGSGTGSKDATATGGKKKKNKNKHDPTGDSGSDTDSQSSHGASTASTRDSTDTSVTRPANERRRSKALAHTLAAWLNFAKGAIDRNEMVDTDGDGVLDTTFGDLMTEVEAILLDPNATKSDLERAKDLAEAVNSHDEDNPDCTVTATDTRTDTRTGTDTDTGTGTGTGAGSGTGTGTGTGTDTGTDRGTGTRRGTDSHRNGRRHSHGR